MKRYVGIRRKIWRRRASTAHTHISMVMDFIMMGSAGLSFLVRTFNIM